MIELKEVSVHYVGNKGKYEHVIKSHKPLELTDEVQNVLLNYFQKGFKNDEYFHFYHVTDLNLNEVFTYVSAIFDNPVQLHEQSKNIATFLYENSMHPKIKSGELFVSFFENVNFKGEIINAIGLFKTENKDTFLKVHTENHFFDISTDQGININKLDKGCLIYNSDRENGFVICITDKTNATESQFWTDEFLQVEQIDDEYYKTERTMAVFKNYVEERLPEEFEISRADQADFLNRTMDFFSNQERFVTENFSESVLQQPAIIESFNNYKSEYEYDAQEMLADDFGISESAVKKQKKYYKSVIKLDKNFHVYVHGDRSRIEHGEDAKGKFYKLYFEEES
ncbi:MAG: nucleoid-associated protein [Flavobacteriaceae bacterium]|nr:nucleoid-associated protein [Flavobacteriaceae bacterium]